MAVLRLFLERCERRRVELRRFATYDQSMMLRKESRGTVVPLSKDCSIRFDDGPRNGSRAARFCRAAALGVVFTAVKRFADDFLLATLFGPAIWSPQFPILPHAVAARGMRTVVSHKARRVFGVST